MFMFGLVFECYCGVKSDESCHLYAEGNVYPNGGAKQAVDHTVHYSKAQSELLPHFCIKWQEPYDI